MKRTWKTGLWAGLSAGAALLFVAHVLQAQNTAAAPPPTGRVASIDIVKVFNEYEKQQDFVKELRDAQTTLQAEDKKRREDLDRLRAELDKMQVTDPEYQKRAKSHLAMSIDYKNWADIKQASINREIGVWSAQFYREIVSATEAIAVQQGYDAVFYRDEFMMPENGDPQAIREQIRNRKLIYSNPAIDISQQVLDSVNLQLRGKPKAKMLDIGP